MIQSRKFPLLILSLLLAFLLVTGLACNLLSAQEVEEVVVEEPIVEEPLPEMEEEPTWSPELAFRLEHTDPNSTLGGVAYTREGNLIGTAALNEVNLWNALDGSLNRSLTDLPINGKALGFSLGDQAFATTTANLGVVLLDIEDGESLINYHRGFDSVLDFSPDGTLITTGTRDGVIWLFDAATGEMLIEMDPDYFIDEQYSEWVTAVAFAPDGQTIASGHWDGRIFLWEATPDSIELLHMLVLDPEFGKPFDLAFSVDGLYLAAAGGGDAFDDAWVVRVWNVQEGTLEQSLAVARRNEAVAFSPDGSLLASGDREAIRLWSYPEFELLHVIENPNLDENFYVTDLDFSPDSQYLVAGYSENYALVWQVQE